MPGLLMGPIASSSTDAAGAAETAGADVEEAAAAEAAAGVGVDDDDDEGPTCTVSPRRSVPGRPNHLPSSRRFMLRGDMACSNDTASGESGMFGDVTDDGEAKAAADENESGGGGDGTYGEYVAWAPVFDAFRGATR